MRVRLTVHTYMFVKEFSKEIIVKNFYEGIPTKVVMLKRLIKCKGSEERDSANLTKDKAFDIWEQHVSTQRIIVHLISGKTSEKKPNFAK